MPADNRAAATRSEIARQEVTRIAALSIAYKAAVDDDAREQVLVAIVEAALTARAALRDE